MRRMPSEGRWLSRAAAAASALSVALVAASAAAQSQPLLGDEVQRRGRRPATNDLMGAILANTGLGEVRSDPDARSLAEGLKPPPFVDFVPRAALVVRDWRGSMRIAGPGTVLDDVRPSASARSVLVRVGFGSRLAPFVQAGVGQWRFDPVLFPSLGVKDRVAASVGAGVQLQLGRISLAAEAQRTALYEAGTTALDEPDDAFVTVLFAARATF